MAGNVQRNKAVNYRQFAAILNGKSTFGLVHHEIRYGHFSAGNESRQVREQSDHNENSADQLDPCSGPT